MEYPILPGAVVPPDVAYVAQRQYAMERQPQTVDRMPNQPIASVPLMRTAAPAVLRPIELQPVVQPTIQIPTISSNVVHPTNERSGRKRTSCRMKVVIVVSVLLVCLTIGAGIAVWAVYGRGGNDSSSEDKVDDDLCNFLGDKDKGKNKDQKKNSGDVDEDEDASEDDDQDEDFNDKDKDDKKDKDKDDKKDEDEHDPKDGSTKKKKSKKCS